MIELMVKKHPQRSLGKEINARLQRFTATLATKESLNDQFTCRTLKLSFRPDAYTPTMVKETRAILKVSQPIFARFLGVSVSAVRDWEQGLKPPRGAACRMMDEIRRNPTYFRERLRELATPVPGARNPD